MSKSRPSWHLRYSKLKRNWIYEASVILVKLLFTFLVSALLSFVLSHNYSRGSSCYFFWSILFLCLPLLIWAWCFTKIHPFDSFLMVLPVWPSGLWLELVFVGETFIGNYYTTIPGFLLQGEFLHDNAIILWVRNPNFRIWWNCTLVGYICFAVGWGRKGGRGGIAPFSWKRIQK